MGKKKKKKRKTKEKKVKRGIDGYLYLIGDRVGG